MISKADLESRILQLKKIEPFSGLSHEVIIELAQMLVEERYTSDTIVYKQDVSPLYGIDIIIEGAYKASYFDSTKSKRLEETYSKGSVYGGGSILSNKKLAIRTVKAVAGTTIYFLEKEEFKALCRGYEFFFKFFSSVYGQKILDDTYAHFVRRHNTRDENFLDADSIYSRTLSAFEKSPVVIISKNASISEASQLMNARQTSCVFIGDDTEITGYLTHRAIVEKALAKGISVDDKVEHIMLTPVTELHGDNLVYEAILHMFSTRTDYIVVKDETDMGMLSRHKLLSEHAQSPLVFLQTVKMAHTTEELQEKWHRAPEIVNQLIGRGVKASIVNQIVTTISDTILHRIIENTVSEIGEPPCKFAFMVLGSEGRKEQTLLTDQDNALVYEDLEADKRESVRAYFLDFATKISDKLDVVGFSYCTGGYMAKNPKWCHSLSHWKNNYKDWIENSTPKTVIQVSTFFDCRFIYGDASMFDRLQEFVNEELKNVSSRFYYNLALNALQYEPPLGMFNALKTIIRDDKKVLNIKRAMTPIVDLARMHALRNNIIETNTGKRLEAIWQAGVFNASSYNEISQAYYYLMGLRFKMQAKNMVHDYLLPTNYLEPSVLTKVEKTTLIEILKVIKSFQSRMKSQFGMGV